MGDKYLGCMGPSRTRWQVKLVKVSFNEPGKASRDELESLLNDGWEPFAVTQPNAITYTTYHLRKSSIEYIYTGPR